jgi:hypothetical protein
LDASLLIFVIAIVISAATFAYQIRANRRQLFLNVQEDFVSRDRQRGRRRLWQLKEKETKASLWSDEDVEVINGSLSQLNTLGYLYVHRHIPRSDARTLLGLTTRRALEAAEATGFIALRDAQQGEPVWPYIRKFTDDVKTASRLREFTDNVKAAIRYMAG